MTADPRIRWVESGITQEAIWRSENGSKPPSRVMVIDDACKADTAYRLACEGTAMLWRGDFQNARQLLQAMSRRLAKKPSKSTVSTNRVQAFHLYRQSQLQRAKILGMLLVPLDENYAIPLRRAPDVKSACLEAFGPSSATSIVSLRELLGVIGAHEWRRKGIEIPVLGGRIHPHYGVFSSVRGEYLHLVAEAPLGPVKRAFDIGTGTGVIAAILARRGVTEVIATDHHPRALICARENIAQLGLEDRVSVVDADLFPEGKADLVVCNPPWLPASANSALDHAIYDPDSRMLRGYLQGLATHLELGGEGWLILSDLAEHLALRSANDLNAMIHQAGLTKIDQHTIRPRHPKTLDQTDPLHEARSRESTMLIRLRVAT